MEQGKIKLENMHPIGFHTLVDLSGCDAILLNNSEAMQAILLEVARQIGANVVRCVMHPFAPIGVSGVLIISESHITVHTWPEYSYAAFDFFTCGQELELENGIAYLIETLHAKTCTTKRFERSAVL